MAAQRRHKDRVYGPGPATPPALAEAQAAAEETSEQFPSRTAVTCQQLCGDTRSGGSREAPAADGNVMRKSSSNGQQGRTPAELPAPKEGGEEGARGGWRWHLRQHVQLRPRGSSTSSQNQGGVSDGNEAGAVSAAAADPVFIHGGEQLQDVPLPEAQVTIGGAGVVTQRPDSPAQQTPPGIQPPGPRVPPREAPTGPGRGFDIPGWSQ